MRYPRCQRDFLLLLVVATCAIVKPGRIEHWTTTVDASEATPQANPALNAEAIAHFEQAVRPLFEAKCLSCHGDETQEAELRLDSPARILSGGANALVIPGNPDGSRLVQLVRGTDSVQMPPDDRLSNEEIAGIERWVAEGAVWPGYEAAPPLAIGKAPNNPLKAEFSEEQRAFWAFQPPTEPPVPAVSHMEWPSNDLDKFILAKLEDAGLQPVPPADKLTLLRRVTFDLTGLPPTPEEIAHFLADQSAGALATVVDRLLASPRYGEKWGQHWLDVVRFAESAGHDGNNAYLLAWRFRDYVIKAFNEDKPYDQFILEQLAGDLLSKTGDPTRDFDQIVATGFLQVGPKPVVMRDKRQMALDIADEQLNATGIAFMALTLGCARCHDHKFDPIPTADYYSLAGIFMSTAVMADEAPDSKWVEYVTVAPDGQEAKVMAVRDRPEPKNLPIHQRGSYHSLGPEAPRRFLQIIAGIDHDPISEPGSGRLALARWIASEEHPLTARVMVNRIWQHHFGRGLVATSGNFGRLGSTPTHPELLDWLALRLIENGWSIKAMHRLMLLSSAYQQAFVSNPLAAASDPENDLLWRMRRRRLSAEEVRDTLLAVSGQLDLTMGGTLFTEGYTPVDAARELYTIDISGKETYPPFERPRRGIYLPVLRNSRPDVLKLFDAANEHEPASVRGETTVAPQALFFSNSPFVRTAAGWLAVRLMEEADSRTESSAEQIAARAFRLALCRDPTDGERQRILAFVNAYAHAAAGLSDELPPEAFLDDPQIGNRIESASLDRRNFFAWRAACHALLCLNEFVYVD